MEKIAEDLFLELCHEKSHLVVQVSLLGTEYYKQKN